MNKTEYELGIDRTTLNLKCHDCSVREGELHRPGCDMERCPFCGGQLISCNCCYEKLKIDSSEGTWTYEHGLTPAQMRKWDKILREKGLIPYIQPFNLCATCGAVNPIMFMVKDLEWEKYVIPEYQRTVLCQKCFEWMKTLFPNGWNNKEK